MLDEKAAPHGAGPITRSTYSPSENNSNSDRKWRRILKLLASGAELTRFDAEKDWRFTRFNSTVSTLRTHQGVQDLSKGDNH